MGRLSTPPPRIAKLKPHRVQKPEGRQEFDRDRAKVGWRKWYNTARWRKLRMATLIRDRFTCQICGLLTGDTSKLVADHKKPHRGDERLFWDEGNLQCLCAPCHNSVKQKEERGLGESWWN